MITKLIVKNYIPLAKKNVTYVELSTKEVFNIILGRNGFGKTSLMRELTADPPDNADYLPGGYKESHHVVGKDTYILKSTTGKSSEHHFIHNGKNLNEGMTLSVQRELVKIHFGYTNNIKNIITGLDVRDLFTTLSAARRKDFLMAVNPNDTTFGLKVFDKLKGNLNALKGGLKTQRQRLVVEEGRLAQLAALDATQLQNEIKTMDDQIKNALIIHGSLQSIQRADLSQLKSEIGDIISFLMGSSTSVTHPYNTLMDMRSKVEGTLDYYKNRELMLSTMLSEAASQLSGLDMANYNLDTYLAKAQNNRTAIALNQEELVSLANKYVNHELFKDVYDDGEFHHHARDLISQLHNVNRAADPNVTSDKYKTNTAKRSEIKIELETVKAKANEIRHTINHYNKAESVDCPKCSTNFKSGFNNIDVKQLTSKLSSYESRGEELTKTLITMNDWLEANEGWYESMGGLMRFAQRSSYSHFIIKMVAEYQVGKTDISVLIDLIRNTTVFADVKKTLDVLKEETENIEIQIKFLEGANVETLFKRAQYLERELSVTQSGVQRQLNEIRNIDRQLDIIVLDEQKRDRLSNLVKEMEAKLIQNGQYRVKARVEEIISDLTPRKDQLISNLIRAESLNSVIQSIKDNIADMERREKHTALLMEGLSPVKGLIGYLMNDFLKSVVANVNAIIQPIWTNRLHVLNCTVNKDNDDVDLSYNFPVLTGSTDKTNKDVGDCSGGEREIINFAFRLVLRRYLGERCSLPLMMDEVGVAFDELHRGRFAAYIEEQLRLDKLPQVFMISHSYKEYASNSKANFIALNTEGIRIGFDVNKNSVIK